MFSSLAGMQLSEYVRRRRLTVAAAEVVANERDLLSIAVPYGYGSTEAFGRAFRSAHGTGPGDVRRDGGPLRTQPQLRFRLTVEGSTTMDTRIVERPAFRLVGHAARVPLIHQGVNPHIRAHVASFSAEEHLRLKRLGNTQPSGLLQVSDDLDAIEVPAGTWAAFRTSGSYPAALQETWAATATDWFPSNPWRLRSGPSLVAVLDRVEDFSTATCELWLPVERAFEKVD